MCVKPVIGALVRAELMMASCCTGDSFTVSGSLKVGLGMIGGMAQENQTIKLYIDLKKIAKNLSDRVMGNKKTSKVFNKAKIRFY